MGFVKKLGELPWQEIPYHYAGNVNRLMRVILFQTDSSLKDESAGRSLNFGYDAQLCTNEKMMTKFLPIDNVYVSCC